MSHLHVPDGVLPHALWIAGLALALVALFVSAWFTRALGPQRIAYQSTLGGIMLAVMAIPVPITAFDYCMTLSGPIGVLLGGWGAFQISFIVTVILALMGQGGFTVIGLNALVLGLGAAVARPVYRLTVGALRPAGAMAVATASSQALSSALWIALVALAVRMRPVAGGEHEVAGVLQFVTKGALVSMLAPMLAAAILLESILGAGIARFLARVRPDMLPAAPGPAPAALEAAR